MAIRVLVIQDGDLAALVVYPCVMTADGAATARHRTLFVDVISLACLNADGRAQCAAVELLKGWVLRIRPQDNVRDLHHHDREAGCALDTVIQIEVSMTHIATRLSCFSVSRFVSLLRPANPLFFLCVGGIPCVYREGFLTFS